MVTKHLGRKGSLGVLRTNVTQLWGVFSHLLATRNHTLTQTGCVPFWALRTPHAPLSLHFTRGLLQFKDWVYHQTISSLKGLVFSTFVSEWTHLMTPWSRLYSVLMADGWANKCTCAVLDPSMKKGKEAEVSLTKKYFQDRSRRKD